MEIATNSTPNFTPRFPAALDATMLTTYIACPHKFFRKYVLRQRLPADIDSIHLRAGKALASGLEAARRAFWLEGAHADLAQEIGRDALLAEYGPDRPQEIKNHARMLECFDACWGRWPMRLDEGMQIVAPEQSMTLSTPFVHPDTGEALIYCGRIDALARTLGSANPFEVVRDGALWGIDDKTTSSFGYGFEKKWELNWQMLGYMYMLAARGTPVEGIQIRGVCTGNARSRWKACDATLEIPVHYEAAVCNAWHSDLLQVVQRVLTDYRAQTFHRVYGDACTSYGGCEFKGDCMQRLTKIVWREETWNPLTKN